MSTKISRIGVKGVGCSFRDLLNQYKTEAMVELRQLYPGAFVHAGEMHVTAIADLGKGKMLERKLFYRE